MEEFFFPPGERRLSDFSREMALQLQDEFKIELRLFDAVINDVIEMDTRKVRNTLVVRLSLLRKRTIFRLVSIGDGYISLDTMREKIAELTKIHRKMVDEEAGKKEVIIPRPVAVELYEAGKEVIASFDEILSGRTQSPDVMNFIRLILAEPALTKLRMALDEVD